MGADDLAEDEQWPIPPAWAMECDTCTALYRRMVEVREAFAEAAMTVETGKNIDVDPFDSQVGAQIRLSRHMVIEHLPLLPDWVTGCSACVSHEEGLARPLSDVTRPGAEFAAADHRARHLIVPPAMAFRW